MRDTVSSEALTSRVRSMRREKKAAPCGSSLFKINNNYHYKLKSARVSGYSLLSTFVFIFLKAFTV